MIGNLRNGWRGRLLLGAGWCGLTALAAGADAPSNELLDLQFRGQSFTVRFVDPHGDLRLFWKDAQDRPLRDFAALKKFAGAKGEFLDFAANAGMFEPDARPVGLLVQDGDEKSPLNLNDGTGNFYMKPNGVFGINEKHEAFIVESSAYAALLSPATWATQSGPLLVHGGSISPDFNADSKSMKVRSGVGLRKDGVIVFAISRGPVNFYDFASLFSMRLKCPNALYLDGEISAFYIPGMKDAAPHSFGPMFGLVVKTKNQ